MVKIRIKVKNKMMKIFLTPVINIAYKATGVIALLLLCCVEEAKAQLNPLNGIYFQNQYLANPAMAGLDEGLKLNLGVRKQWATMPGSPRTQSLSGHYAFTEKVGAGISVYNDKSGLLSRTRVMGSYAYHLPLNESSKLSFGISLGFMNERIMNENISGDANDTSVDQFNQRETYMDGDFGAAYTGKRLTLQAAIPNMKRVFKKDVSDAVDRGTFFSAASYKFAMDHALPGFAIEPKVVLRGVKGHDNIIDAGANFSFSNTAFNFMALYHTSQSATFGFGVELGPVGQLLGMFTTETSILQGYTGATFELGLKLNLFSN